MTTEQMDAVDAAGTESTASADKPAHIFGAVKEVMAKVRGFAKTGQMTGSASYNFQRYEEMAEKIGELFREQSVMTQTQVLSQGRDQWDKTTNNRTTRWTSAWVHVAFMFTSLVDGTSVHVEAMGEGADSSDKAFNKAMTGAYKNAFKIGFTLSTKEDDPDDERPDVTPDQEVSRNDPWGKVQLAARAQSEPRHWSEDQKTKVAKAVKGLPGATLESLDRVADWAIEYDLLSAPVGDGGTLAAAMLGTRDALRGRS